MEIIVIIVPSAFSGAIQKITSGQVDPPPAFSNRCEIVKEKKTLFFLHAAP